jgi:hypothetical protein
MELSLYYSRVEPHIGHLLPRSKSGAPSEYLKRHWTHMAYSLNSISTHSRDIVLKRPKVQGGVTQGPHPFPRISGMTPNRTTRGPVSSPAKQPTNKGAEQPLNSQIE